MTMPVELIEVGFEISPSGAILFTLDDPVKGALDNSEYKLGGTTLQFIDVTDRVKSFSISRGKSNLFSSFPAGQLNVSFNNHDRAFDPLYDQSPFVGNIVPRREIRASTSGEIQYTGWIDDWAYSYLPNGDSIAEAIAYDATSIISNQILSAGTPTAEKTGARVAAVLDEINWPTEFRSIDAGQANLSNFPIEANENAFTYLQTVANSEPGLIFIDKLGRLKFLDRAQSPTSANFVQFGGTGIPFQNLEVSYGSDNLYNQVIIARAGGGTATATDTQSVIDYGLRALDASEVLLATDNDLAELALVLAEQYSQPEYRFSSLEVALHKLDADQQSDVMGIDLGSISRIEFTPNNIGSSIIRFVQVISINHTVRTDRHFVEFGFQSVESAYLVLDDAEFGKLDTYGLSW